MRTWLARSRELGFLGPGPVEGHITHALGFAAAFEAPPRSVLDLGSGGGLPGLVLADLWQETGFTLLDSNERRAGFLSEVVAALRWTNRVRVVRARAEVAGRAPALRHRFDAVVSRSFGPPPAAAECGAPFLEVDGRFVVSEPPEPGDRWPEEGVGQLGLRAELPVVADATYMVLRQVSLCPDRYPRREGLPVKRPLW